MPLGPGYYIVLYSIQSGEATNNMFSVLIVVYCAAIGLSVSSDITELDMHHMDKVSLHNISRDSTKGGSRGARGAEATHPYPRPSYFSFFCQNDMILAQ